MRRANPGNTEVLMVMPLVLAKVAGNLHQSRPRRAAARAGEGARRGGGTQKDGWTDRRTDPVLVEGPTPPPPSSPHVL